MEIILAAAVSLLVQFLKKWSKNEWTTLLAVFVLSLVGAALYTYVYEGGYWQVFATVLTTAGAFYTFIIARFEK